MPSASDEHTRAWIRAALKERYGDGLVRLILAGSRAKGTNLAGSDWDVLAVIAGYRSIWPVGPLRMNDKLIAPDGNLVEAYEMNPDDLHHPRVQGNALIHEALALDTDV